MDGAVDAARLAALRPVLEARDRLQQAVRSFFSGRDYLEVTTPVRVATPAMEEHIDAFASGEAWLRTSPELHLKRLVAAGYRKIFQLGPCFREGERGGMHHPEYSMLEWYEAALSLHELVDQLKTLLVQGTTAVSGTSIVTHRGGTVDLAGPWESFAVRDLFLEHAGWDPVEAFDADRFDADFVAYVEPWLAERPVPVVLYAYPVGQAALARPSAEDPGVAERLELFVAGVELCNAYHELADAAEQRRRFEAWGHTRADQGRPVYPLDEPFLAALEAGLPDCSGAALGVDRWLLLALGCDDFDQLLPFREG